jgi:hypothetical protein
VGNFSKNSYKAHDLRAKTAALEFFDTLGYSVETNPDEGTAWNFKCPDLIVEREGQPSLYFEVQVNAGWEGISKPDHWSSFQCWGRKLDQITYPDGQRGEKGYWFTMSNNLKFAVACPFGAKPETFGTRPNPRFGKEADVNPRELFCEFSLDECLFVDLEAGKVKHFNSPKF